MKILAAALVDTTKNDASLIHFRELARALSRLGHRVDTLLPGMDCPAPIAAPVPALSPSGTRPHEPGPDCATQPRPKQTGDRSNTSFHGGVPDSDHDNGYSNCHNCAPHSVPHNVLGNGNRINDDGARDIPSLGNIPNSKDNETEKFPCGTGENSRGYDDSLTSAFIEGLRQAWRIAALAPQYDAVYIRWRLLPALLPRLLSELRNGSCPPVVTEHNGWVGAEVRVQRGSRLLGVVGTGLQYFDSLTASATVAVTPQIGSRLMSVSGPLAVVDNGTDIDHFHPLPHRDTLKQELLGTTTPVVGFCGNLSRWQGLSLVARAFSRVAKDRPDARLLVVGSGMAGDEVRREVHALGIAERVHFAGDVNYADMNRWLNVMDVSLCPKSVRLAEYGYSPLKVRDSAAAGRPVVATRVTGLAELEGEWLRCFAPEDETDLGRVLLELLADPAKLERMGQAARAHAEAHFGWDKAAHKVERLLWTVCDGTSSPQTTPSPTSRLQTPTSRSSDNFSGRTSHNNNGRTQSRSQDTASGHSSDRSSA